MSIDEILLKILQKCFNDSKKGTDKAVDSSLLELWLSTSSTLQPDKWHIGLAVQRADIPSSPGELQSAFSPLLDAVNMVSIVCLSVCQYSCLSVCMSACICPRHRYMCDQQVEGCTKAATNHSAAVHCSAVSHQPKQVRPPALCLCDELRPAACLYLWWWPCSLCIQQVSKFYLPNLEFCELIGIFLAAIIYSCNKADQSVRAWRCCCEDFTLIQF